MKKWEYLAVYHTKDVDANVLLGYGMKGWELVAVLERNENKKDRWIFKKEIIEGVSPVDND